MRSTRLPLLIAVILLAASLSSCTTSNLTTNKTGWSDYAGIAIKDFTVVGHVRVESEEVTVVSPLRINTSHTGGKVTYDMLLAAAKKAGGDDIINVRIDSVGDSKRSLFDMFTGYTAKRTYIGNALAIKYTTAQPNFRDHSTDGDPSGIISEGQPSLLQTVTGVLGIDLTK